MSRLFDKNVVRISLAIFLLASIHATMHGQVDTLRTVGLEGAPVTNYESELSFASFHVPVINDLGQVAIDAEFTGPDVTGSDDRGVFSEGGGGGLYLVTRGGRAAPGVPGRNLYNFSVRVPSLFDDGKIAFVHSLAGVTGGRSDTLLYRGESSNLELLYRRGAMQTSGIPDSITGFDAIRYNEDAKVAFIGEYSATTEGVYVERQQGSFTLVADNSTVAPSAGGATFDSFGSLTHNRQGDITFVANLEGSGVTGANVQSIYKSTAGGGLQLVLREGQIAPGVGRVFSDTDGKSAFRTPKLNERGDLAFVARVSGTLVNDEVLYTQINGAFNVIAEEGQAVPGLSAVFRNIDPIGNRTGSFELNNLGNVAFVSDFSGAGISSSENEGIFVNSPSGLELAIREGAQAPGTQPGVVFGTFYFTELAFNDLDQLAFIGRLAGADVDATNDSGLFLTDQLGMLHLIAREGDLLNVADGSLADDLRTVQSLAFDNSQGLNNKGEVVFRAIFTDGTSGIFVSSKFAAVPEPGTISVLLMFITLGSVRRKRY